MVTRWPAGKAAALIGIASILASGCAASPKGSGVTTTTKPSPSTTTTTGLPATRQPSAEAAATAFVADWAAGNRSAALAFSTPAAVTTLFAVPYPEGLAISRGCSTAFLPIVCTYGPPGGAPPTDPIYEIYLSQTAAGWYVSSTKVN